ncbi:hypothetical protein [Cytobacillus oceanisediminis]|uniref:hypothetical protein n=1 Tax=Cytobacillus oceanisediminis TaxID=665099 RepID=UPI0037352A81
MTTYTNPAFTEGLKKVRERYKKPSYTTQGVGITSTSPNTLTGSQSQQSGSATVINQQKPTSSGAPSSGINNYQMSEIQRKAQSGESLMTPTKEKQALYDFYRNNPGNKAGGQITDYQMGEIIRKAQQGIELAVPTAEKLAIYNLYANKKTEPEKRPSFTFEGRPTLSYEDAANRAGQQVDPLYARALENIKAQKYQNELNSGEIAAKRGLGHSGLAADQLTKIAIASQGQIADTEAERAAKIAEMAQAMYDRDQDLAYRERQQAFQEYLGQENIDFNRDQFDYSKTRDVENDRRYYDNTDYQRGRDVIGDQWRQKEWDYNLGRDKTEDSRWEKQWDYQVGRDKVADDRYKSETEWNQQREKMEYAWRKYTYNNMSAQDKAQLDYNKMVHGEDMAWKMFEMEYNGELAKSQSQAELDYYSAMDFLP